jgi:hypothetical protein
VHGFVRTPPGSALTLPPFVQHRVVEAEEAPPQPVVVPRHLSLVRLHVLPQR